MWAVIDVETTGVYWRSVDRIIEIAVVRLDDDGRAVDTWETLLDPDRDLGPTSIHGITGRDVMGAPTFDQVADEILWRLAGHVPVGHNVRFDLAFLTNEFARLGLDFSPVEGVCTMAIAGEMGAGRSLVDCCSAFGVPIHDHHTARADAEATGRIFEQMLAIGGWQYPPPLPAWPRPAALAPVRTRSDPPLSRVPRGVVSLARTVGIPDGSPVEYAAAASYFDLLDRVLEDRRLTKDEVEALSDLASEWGISEEDADRLHRAYITETWKLAEADGVVTRAEMRDIENLAGATLCSEDGVLLERADLEAYAADAGMIIKTSVSRRLDLLVVADPDSRSGKAKKADELGVRRMYDVAFLRALGVECDAGGGDDD